MRQTIEIMFFGLALSSLFAIYLIYPFSPYIVLSPRRVIVSIVIALFFPFISIKKRIILSAIYPSRILPYLPSVISHMHDVYNIMANNPFFIHNPPPEILVEVATIIVLASFYYEPFAIFKTYKKIGLYDKFPFFTAFCEDYNKEETTK